MRHAQPWPAWHETVSTAFLEQIVGEASRRGVDPSELRADAGLRHSDGSRVPAGIVYRIWELAVERSADPALPVALAQTTPLDSLGLLGFAVMTSPSLARGLDCAATYYGLVTTSGRWSLREQERELHVGWTRAGALTRGLRISNESAFCQFIAGVRSSVGAHVRPLRVRFRHPPGASRKALGAYFDARVEFDASEDEIVLGLHDTERVPRLANAQLNTYLRDAAAVALRPLLLPSVVAAVRHELRARLASATLEMREIARQLGMTRRTLHRRLAAEGTGFAALLDSVRREEAAVRLEQPDARLGAIAFELGFADASTFSRARKRWGRR